MDWYMDALKQIDRVRESTSSTTDDDTLDIFDILLVLASKRRMIGTVASIALLVGVIISLLLKPNFIATAIILPPQQSSSSSALLSQLGSLASLGGGASALGMKSPADMYIGILQSRTIADTIISNFQLQALYKEKKLEDARTSLKAHTAIEAGKDGLIHISFTDHDARRASDIANAYVGGLYSMNSNLAVGEAAQRRAFFDQQLEEEKKALAFAEEDLRMTQQKTGLIQLSGQAQMIIQTIAKLRADIASREVEMQVLRTSATDQNPEMARLNSEISTMRQQLSKLENDQQRGMSPGNIAVPASRVPQDALEYTRKYREFKYHETLFDLLSRQYEAARIDEAKSLPIIQVIDHAVPPDKRSGPKRALIVLGLGFLGAVLGSVWALIKNGLSGLHEHPEYSSKLQRLAQLFNR